MIRKRQKLQNNKEKKINKKDGRKIRETKKGK